MSRYYTSCIFSGSRKTRYSSVDYEYPKAPTGFLFHDTENLLKYDELRKPVHYLAELYEGARSVLLCRVNDQTIAATFSTDFIPYPIKYEHYDHDSRSNQKVILPKEDTFVGLIKNVNDPAEIPTILKIGEIYDQCPELSRLTGNCPCTKLTKENRCPQTEKIFPEGYVHNAWFNEVEGSVFKRKTLQNIHGFEYVSPGHTIVHDFTKGLRGWDEHDFTLVETRKDTFKERGASKRTKDAHRKKHCSKCAFHTIRTDVREHRFVYDCGDIHRCTYGAVSSDLAWQVLLKYHDLSRFDKMDGFTIEQRDYLLRNSGHPFMQRGIMSHIRKTNVALGTFIYLRSKREWAYTVHAAAGDLTRYKAYLNYTDLRNDVSFLPEKFDKEHKLNQLQALACMLFGVAGDLRGSGWGSSYYPIAHLVVSDTSVNAEAVGRNGVMMARGIPLDSTIPDWYMFAFGYNYSGALPFLAGETDIGHSFSFKR